MGRDKIQTILLIILLVLTAGVFALVWQNIPNRSVAADKGLIEHFRTYANAPSFSEETKDLPSSFTRIHEIQVDNCPPNPDGICGYSLYIYGPADWKSGGEKTFYFATSSGGPLRYFGPLSGDLNAIMGEAAYVKALTDEK